VIMTTSPQGLELLALEIKTTRKLKGWSQDDLAKHSGVPRGSIANIETAVTRPKSDTVRKLARSLGANEVRWQRLAQDLPPDVEFSSGELAAILDAEDPAIRKMLIDGFSLPPDLKAQFVAAIRVALAVVRENQRP
jgi:transcriptional regulator with XRE-family HTH domain